MAYTQTLFDDFNDNSLNAAKWSRLSTATTITEASTRLNVPMVSTYPQLQGIGTFFNAATGILAFKVTRSGTFTAESEFYIGLHDNAGNYIQVVFSPFNTFIGFQVYGATTFSSAVITDTTVGLGSSWVGGTWLGLGNIGSDNICRLYKSTDGQTWTEMARCTLGGTFGKTTTQLWTMGGIYTTTSSATIQLDDASYWLNGSSSATFGKVRVGGVWISPSAIKVRSGGAWVTPTAIKVRAGGLWVTAS